ncbi:hypothetical protein UCD39_01695 [Nitrospirillum sp. BR 11752]|uniref:hypothetical protein n=1 Tax=Nitrospirillum sp. BR 11752 TaxID=3104293 RepID=UPI002EAEB455|nr:hypothetical protein [Nitrospirillum sp. BR 11752]
MNDQIDDLSFVGFVRNIHVNRIRTDDGGFRLDVKIHLFNGYEENSPSIEIEFIGVAEIELGNANFMSSSLITIYNMSSHQLDRIKYHVVDEEAKLFAFYRREFSRN